MNLDNLLAKIFLEKNKPKEEIAPTPQESPKERYRSSPQETILESHDLERVGKLLGGCIGNTRFVKIRDDGGSVFKSYTKFEDYPKLKIELISKERAAYLISRFLGFDFVPPTIIKVVDGKKGSLQEFVEDAQVGKRVRYKQIDQRELAKLNIFDGLIANTDRHRGNYLVKDGKIFAIDHSHTLDLKNLSSGFYIKNVPPDLAGKLKKFIESEEQKSILSDLLAELLSKSVVSKFMKRVVAFVESVNEDYSFDYVKFYNLVSN